MTFVAGPTSSWPSSVCGLRAIRIACSAGCCWYSTSPSSSRPFRPRRCCHRPDPGDSSPGVVHYRPDDAVHGAACAVRLEAAGKPGDPDHDHGRPDAVFLASRALWWPIRRSLSHFRIADVPCGVSGLAAAGLASLFAVIDRGTGGVLWPQLSFDVSVAGPWGVLQYIGWMAVLDAFLVTVLRQNVREMEQSALHTAELEDSGRVRSGRRKS